MLEDELIDDLRRSKRMYTMYDYMLNCWNHKPLVSKSRVVFLEFHDVPRCLFWNRRPWYHKTDGVIQTINPPSSTPLETD